MQLKTKRLVIRDVKETDAEQMVQGINHIEISQYLRVVPHPYTRKDAKWFIQKSQKAAKEKPRTKYSLAIIHNKKVVGCIGLESIDFYTGTAEIGYWLAKEHQQQGIMTEAVTAVIDFAFVKLKLQRVYAYASSENIPSQKLLRKLGFTHEGTERRSVRMKATGKHHDTHSYGLLKEEWRSRR